MTYYLKEIKQIRSQCYSNQGQIDTVIDIRHYIDEHYDQNITLDLLSEIRFTSKYHLLRLFKRYYGQTPMQYVTDRRLDRSKELLAQGYSVSATCYAVGFESPSSFSTLFRSRYGVSPIDFKKKSNFHKVSFG